jgi:AcrR family transcriptional regulator
MAENQAKNTYHREDLRSELIEAGLACLTEEGLATLSLRGIARRARVTHSAPYSHFKDRKALVAAIAQRGFEELAARQRNSLETTSSPRAGLQAMGLEYIQFALRNPALFRLMFSNEISNVEAYPGLFAVALESYGLIQKVCGEVAKEPVQADLLTYSSWALVHGLTELMIEDRLANTLKSEEQKLEFAKQILNTQFSRSE